MNKGKKFSDETQKDDFEDCDNHLEVSADEENIEQREEKELNIEEVIAENQKLKDSFLRAYAEAENVQKRCQQEMEKSVKFAVADFAKSLLSVADNLQRALDAARDSSKSEEDDAFRKGIELTQTELMKVFDKFHIHRMDIIGKVFVPNFHQVVQEVEDVGKPSGTIVAEVQQGYMIYDRILREAMVIVAK